MQKFQPDKFKWHEIFSNSDGKSSASSFAGIILMLTASVSFLATMVGWFMNKADVIDVMEEVVIIASIAAALLGVRKVFGSAGKTSLFGDKEKQTANKNKTVKNKKHAV
jgi:hypothetical protein